MLEIGWKSFGNRCRPCFEVIEIFLHLQLLSEVVRKSSEAVGNLQRSSEAFGKSSEIQILWRRKISHILLKTSWQVYNIKGPSITLNCNKCYRLWPSLTAMICTRFPHMKQLEPLLFSLDGTLVHCIEYYPNNEEGNVFD